jgi:hypothetical protein
MINKFLILTLIFLFSLKSYSREFPTNGEYILVIKIQTIDGTPIKNHKIIYENDIYQTDSLGLVSIKVEWIYYKNISMNIRWFFDRLKKCQYRRKVNNINNGKYIYFKDFENNNIYFIKNKWRKYGLKNEKNKSYRIEVEFPIYYRNIQ